MHAQRSNVVRIKPSIAPAGCRREVRGNVIQWCRDAATAADPAVTVHLPAAAYTAARAPKSTVRQSVSPRFFNLCLLGAAFATGLVWLGRWGGLL